MYTNPGRSAQSAQYEKSLLPDEGVGAVGLANWSVGTRRVFFGAPIGQLDTAVCAERRAPVGQHAPLADGVPPF